jgi:beta-glucosidase
VQQRSAWTATAAATLTVDRCCEQEAAVQLASRSDVVVAVLGDDAKSSSEWGDRDNLDLPGDQMPLLTALAATGKPIVLVLVTGRSECSNGQLGL